MYLSRLEEARGQVVSQSSDAGVVQIMGLEKKYIAEVAAKEQDLQDMRQQMADKNQTMYRLTY